jgi:hypothetical protein
MEKDKLQKIATPLIDTVCYIHFFNYDFPKLYYICGIMNDGIYVKNIKAEGFISRSQYIKTIYQSTKAEEILFKLEMELL